MPYLMIDLDDAADCRRGMQQLRQIVGGPNRGGAGGGLGGPGRGGPKRAGIGPRGRKHGGGEACAPDVAGKGAGVDQLPLRQKLQRIKKRGVWRILSGIASLDEKPRSLAEYDAELGLKANKMRSTKAIFAKLENRFDLRFLVLAEAAGEDDAGNARYRMPPRVRNAINNLTD